jgi:hypothetical protein
MEKTPTIEYNEKIYMKVPDGGKQYGCLECAFRGEVDPDTGECATGLSKVCASEKIHFVEVG